MQKLLYTTREARDAISCGVTRLYEHINSGRLEARRFGRRTYITGESLHALVASMARVTTPTMLKVQHEKWSGRRRSRPKLQEVEPGTAK